MTAFCEVISNYIKIGTNPSWHRPPKVHGVLAKEGSDFFSKGVYNFNAFYTIKLDNSPHSRCMCLTFHFYLMCFTYICCHQMAGKGLICSYSYYVQA